MLPQNSFKSSYIFKRLLGDGSNLGVRFDYISQPSPDGLAQAFILGQYFIGDDDVCLILGDNIYYGNDLIKLLHSAAKNTIEEKKATIFGYSVQNPDRYGVLEFDIHGNPVSIEEKPIKPKSNFVVTGLYFYPNNVVQKALNVRPSSRGELEITTINQMYLEDDELNIKIMGRGLTWLDTGTPESLIEASTFIEAIEKRQGLKVACLEEVAYQKGFISKSQLLNLARKLDNEKYSQYLKKLANNDYKK